MIQQITNAGNLGRTIALITLRQRNYVEKNHRQECDSTVEFTVISKQGLNLLFLYIFLKLDVQIWNLAP